MIAKELKDFTLTNCELCFRDNDRILARPLCKVEAKEKLQCIHNIFCGDNDASLYRNLQTGMRWPRKLLTFREVVSGSRNP